MIKYLYVGNTEKQSILIYSTIQIEDIYIVLKYFYVLGTLITNRKQTTKYVLKHEY